MDGLVKQLPVTSILIAFAIDVLVEITRRVSGSDIVRLWMCGSRQLNYKLGVCGGARVLSVDSSATYEMQWPAVITASLAHLDTFRFKCKHLHHNALMKDVDFTTLPSTIKHIDVAFYNDVDNLHRALLSSPTHFSRLETVRVRGHSSIMGTSQADLIRILPKSTRSIRLLEYYNPANMATCALRIDEIPPNVTTLKTRDVYIIAAKSDGDSEGHTLSHLTTYATTVDGGAWLSVLPRHLQSLTVGRLDDEYLHLLPRTLTKLNVAHIQTLSLFVAALPRSLTKLNAPLYSYNMIDAYQVLPHGLTAAISCLPARATPEILKALPPSLTDLYSTGVRLCDIPLLPPRIALVNISGPTDEFVLEHALPHSCTRLKIPGLNDSCIDKLPPNLTRLSVRRNITTLACLAALPASLVHFTIHGRTNTKDDHFEYFSRLPRDLRIFKLKYGSSNSAYHHTDRKPSSYALPRTLESLSLTLSDVVLTDWYGGLPSRLVHVRLKFQTIFFDLNAANALSAALTCVTKLELILNEWDVPIIGAMPHTLHTLCIRSNAPYETYARQLTTPAIDALFECLPPRLVDCTLPLLMCSKFDDSIRRRLPRTLAKFTMGHNDAQWIARPPCPRELDRYYDEL